MAMFGSDWKEEDELYDRSLLHHSEDERPDDSLVIRHFSDEDGKIDGGYEGMRHFGDD